jgi:DNA-binding transcriptional regulator YdaS (Cro superfamily)
LTLIIILVILVTMKLKEYLKTSSNEELAEKIGSTANYVHLLKYNQRRPSPELALKIEKATGGKVTVLELLYPTPYSQEAA